MEVETFDQAFMPYILLPDGQTVFQTAAPRIEAVYKTGKPIELLHLVG